MKGLLKILLLFVSTATLYAQPSPGDRILGIWSTPNQESKIEIVPCGGAYCGSVKSMANPRNDEHNPDPELHSRPLVGLLVLTNFHYAGKDTWTGGTLYSPARGKDFSPTLVLSTPDSLDIKVKAGMMSKTITWTRDK